MSDFENRSFADDADEFIRNPPDTMYITNDVEQGPRTPNSNNNNSNNNNGNGSAGVSARGVNGSGGARNAGDSDDDNGDGGEGALLPGSTSKSSSRRSVFGRGFSSHFSPIKAQRALLPRRHPWLIPLVLCAVLALIVVAVRLSDDKKEAAAERKASIVSFFSQG